MAHCLVQSGAMLQSSLKERYCGLYTGIVTIAATVPCVFVVSKYKAKFLANYVKCCTGNSFCLYRLFGHDCGLILHAFFVVNNVVLCFTMFFTCFNVCV